MKLKAYFDGVLIATADDSATLAALALKWERENRCYSVRSVGGGDSDIRYYSRGCYNREWIARRSLIKAQKGE